ncbi:MAG: aminoacyl-tRNA hydrolase [Bacteroidales bacterium]|nr:aminoacyl-tRNA hydrolase [Bacteroidales bacterium]
MNYLVVGLGNIGNEYAHTRHNLGFMVLDAWAQASNILFESKRYGSVAVFPYRGRKIHLLKPSTYMNLSGNAVLYWIQKIKLPLSNVIVICDDLNLPFGTVRMRLQGSDGGHNGLKSIQDCLGTKRFARIRIGIGNDFHPGEQIDYVLGELGPEKEELIARTGLRIRDGIQTYCTAGPDFAMNFLNSKPQSQEND